MDKPYKVELDKKVFAKRHFPIKTLPDSKVHYKWGH